MMVRRSGGGGREEEVPAPTSNVSFSLVVVLPCESARLKNWAPADAADVDVEV